MPPPPTSSAAGRGGNAPPPPAYTRRPPPLPNPAARATSRPGSTVSSPAVGPSPAATGAGAGKQAPLNPSHHKHSQPTTVVVPPVPPKSWYAAPFTEGPSEPFSDFHARNKGRVVFGPHPIPVRPEELEAAPNRAPHTSASFDLGKDLLYGMAYLHNTALFTEHRWRGRVAHLRALKEGKAEVPELIRKAAELAKKRETGTLGKSVSPPPPAAGAAATAADKPAHGKHSAETSSVLGMVNLARAEPTMYEHPCFDLLLGVKVYVNDTLVADHYPGVRSLPQCTATIDTTEAVNAWTCVPVVLMGYLNHVTLDTIDLYRTMSLSFVEHLLHMKFPTLEDEKVGERSGSAKSTGEGRPAARPLTPPPGAPGTKVMVLNLRVEIVYGCRAEAYYATDFIARGSCTLFLAETAKPALKSYEETLRALVLAKRSSEQIIRAGPSAASATSKPPHGHSKQVRTCQACGQPLVFRCTVCGTEFCGSAMCSRRSLVGYPRGCSAHKAMLD